MCADDGAGLLGEHGVETLAAERGERGVESWCCGEQWLIDTVGRYWLGVVVGIGVIIIIIIVIIIIIIVIIVFIILSTLI